MKILTVADFFYPDTVGGSAIVAYEVMRQLSERGHEIAILTRLQCGAPAREEISGLQVYRYNMPASLSGYPAGVLRAARLMRELLLRESFDIVNIHHASSGIAAAWLSPIPSVFFFHGPWHKEAMAKNGLGMDLISDNAQKRLPLQYYLRKMVDRHILRKCNAFLTLSDYMFDEALDLQSGIEDKHHKIHGGVDLERFKPTEGRIALRRELGLPMDKILLLTIRRLSARMGLENLVEAMSLIEQKRDDIALYIGGQGELEGKLRAQIQRLGLRNTALLGYIEEESLSKYYQVSDLFVMPSLSLEGFGLSTIEAMACGTPVLGTPVGGTREILGLAFADYILSGVSPEAIAAGILKKADEARRMSIRQRVRQWAEQYSWARVADDVECLFESLVGKNRVPGHL